MNQHTYLKKFSCVVRWSLPKPEADEVLADYAEMLSQRPAEDNLVQELGDPVQAARLLTEPKAYCRWLAVFAVMAFCLLLPEVMLLRANFTWIPWRWLPGFLLVGTMVSLAWFRPCRDEARPPLPRGLLPAMAALVLGPLAAGSVIWGLAMHAWEWMPPGIYGSVARWSLSIAGTTGTAAGLWGLVKARTSNRRWRALYVMGLTVLIACAFIMALLTSMDLNGPYGWAPWVPYAVGFGVTGVLGLIGVGVSLC